MTTTLTLRLAEPSDLDAVAQLAVALRDDTHWRDVDFTPDPEAISLWLLAVLSTTTNHVLYVAEQEGQVVGFCLGLLTVHPLVAQVPVIYEQGWYITPEVRSGTLGMDLWHLVVEWGRQRGAKAACYCIPAKRVHLRNGYRVAETLYWKDLE